MPPIKDITGQRFGRLVALRLTDKRLGRSTVWECLCDCGDFHITTSRCLRHGYTKSCGCLLHEKTHGGNLKHGHANDGKLTPEFQAYIGAKQRCTNQNSTSYANYGGRGIKFLFTSFEQFLSEIGRRPKGTTLDRENNEGNYESGNVRWATRKQQANNRRVAVWPQLKRQ